MDTVLIYDEEKGTSTTCFIDALQKHLPELRFKEFHMADDVERNSHYIIAVLRQTSIRIEENFIPLKMQLEKNNVNPKRVIVTYFFMCKPDEGTLRDFRNQSGTNQFFFAKTLLMDFVDKDMEGGYPFFRSLKKINAKAIKELKKSIQSEWSVDYLESKTPLINQFVEELCRSIPSSIPLRKVPDLKSVTSPTLVFCTVNQERHEENVTDLGNIILFHIIDVTDASPEPAKLDVSHATNNSGTFTQSEPCQQYGQIWKVYHNNGKFHVEMKFLKEFESFVRTCYTDMKQVSQMNPL